MHCIVCIWRTCGPQLRTYCRLSPRSHYHNFPVTRVGQGTFDWSGNRTRDLSHDKRALYHFFLSAGKLFWQTSLLRVCSTIPKEGIPHTSRLLMAMFYSGTYYFWAHLCRYTIIYSILPYMCTLLWPHCHIQSSIKVFMGALMVSRCPIFFFTKMSYNPTILDRKSMVTLPL